MSKSKLVSFAMSSVFWFCHNLNCEFFLTNWVFFSCITFWVLRVCPNLFLIFFSFVANWVFELHLNTTLFIPLFKLQVFSFHNLLAIACSCWKISSSFIRSIFYSRFSFICTWPSLFAEKISCLISLSCLSQWDWQQYVLLCTP